MIALYVIAVYILLSAAIYLVLSVKCRTDPVFRMPESAFLYYFLSLTWGLPMTLAGVAVSLVLLAFGKRPRKFCRNICFELPGINWGLELGLFMIIPEGNTGVCAHEQGHGIQNIYLGIFMPAVISIPSAIRFHCRKHRAKKKRPLKRGYDDIWFENSATLSGEAFLAAADKKKEDI